MKFGAIDIGSNAIRLLIGEVVHDEKGSFVKKINYTRIPLRLGMEVFENGCISQHKQEEFLHAIQAFSHIAEMFEVQEIRACATSAMREASNGQEVIANIKALTGISIEIISGDEEARLIFGTFFLLNIDKNEPFVVVDVGGGSTEISVFEEGTRIASKSFEIGTIRLLKQKVSEDDWTQMKAWIAQNVELKRKHTVYATGGNINKINKMMGKDKEALKVSKLVELYDSLKVLTVHERENEFKLNPDRADVIVPACEIFQCVFTALKVQKILVPKIGLSDGIIYDLDQRYQQKKAR